MSKKKLYCVILLVCLLCCACGKKFIVHTLDKVRELRELITNTGSQALIEVDGGVNLETGRQLVEAGADVLVAGNAVFKAPDMSDMIHRLKSL